MQFENETLNPEITSEYNYIEDFAEEIALWNKYTLKRREYNKTSIDKTYAVTGVDSSTTYNFFSIKSTNVVCPNTVKVYYTGTESVVTDSNYYVDLAKNTIKFASGVTGNVLSGERYGELIFQAAVERMAHGNLETLHVGFDVQGIERLLHYFEILEFVTER